MTLPFGSSDTCAVCGAVSEQTGVLSTNEFGAPDLDGRPPEMRRSTINWWVHRCPGCGYCASSIDEAPAGAGDVVRSAAYRQQLDDFLTPELARMFLCSSMIVEVSGGPAAPGLVAPLICAAWACDDAGDVDAAVRCRLRAASAIDALRSAGGSYMDDDPGGDDLTLADLYRRSERFEEAGAAAQAGLQRAADPFLRQLLELQLSLAGARDAGRHTCDEVAGGAGEAGEEGTIWL